MEQIFCIGVFWMRTNCAITLFHFNEDTETFDTFYFPKVYAYSKEKISKNGIKQRGFYLSNSAIIRIPCKKEIDVSLGDYVAMGKSNKKVPDRANDLKIIEICDNRRSSAPHIRLSCGG